uniref:Uncharacterized protein n=1 Tax=Anguilla anguilla TaxID=7936 RepID=A0A0E9TPA1_ANGAN
MCSGSSTQLIAIDNISNHCQLCCQEVYHSQNKSVQDTIYSESPRYSISETKG